MGRRINHLLRVMLYDQYGAAVEALARNLLRCSAGQRFRPRIVKGQLAA
jgi:hypothetical protein